MLAEVSTRRPVLTTQSAHGAAEGPDQLARSWVAAWNCGSPMAVAALCRRDVELVDPVVPRPLRGRAEIAAFVRRIRRSLPDLHVSLVSPPRLLASCQVLVAWRMEATVAMPLHPSAPVLPGTRVEVEGATLWTLRDGHVAHHRAFYDLDSLLPPAPPAVTTALAV